MSKLWIIGDSFAGYNIGYWTDIVSKKFEGKFYISSHGSRDYQTVIDIFLRHLKNISKDDLVILTIPTLERTRLPLMKPNIDVEFSNEYCTFEQKKDIKNYFIGPGSYQPVENKHLEEPLYNLPDEFWEDEQMGLSNRLWSIVNTSNANKQNVLETLESIKSYVPFELYIWSWIDELDSPAIENKSKIKKEIGYWHTLWEEWKESNGKIGREGDSHFSPKMHKAFADYLIVKFPQFFNT